MSADLISITSIHNLSYEEQGNQNEEQNEIFVIFASNTPNIHADLNQSDNFDSSSDKNWPDQCKNENEGTEDLENQVAFSEEKNSKEIFNDITKAVAFSIGIILACVVIAIPWTIIPRTNSIIYQSWWIEALFPFAITCMLYAASDMINLVVWTEENSLKAIKVFLKLWSAYLLSYSFLYVLSYMIWCVVYDFNHPMPYLGLLQVPSGILVQIALWFVLPSDLLCKQEYRSKLRIYNIYFICAMTRIVVNEVLSYFWKNFTQDWKFVLAFLIAACRECYFQVGMILVDKMMDSINDSSIALLTVNVNTTYGMFLATRLTGANLATVCCILAIDFIIHLKTTYQVIKEHRKIGIEESDEIRRNKTIYMANLVSSEFVEGFVPITYGIVMVMAYYGPNANILANIGSSYWGEKIEDIGPVLMSMVILFIFDAISVVVTSLCLWKVVNINMFEQFCDAMNKFGLYLLIKIGLYLSGYFGGLDVNFGGDGTRNFDWITDDGRIRLINNSTHLLETEKLLLLTNATSI